MKTELLGTRKILIVEDDEILLETLVDKFKGMDFEVYSAENVEDAAFFVREKRIDLILLDLILPKIDGFTFLKILKADKTAKKIPVLILSNLADEFNIKKAKKIGAKDYFVKTETDLDSLGKQVFKILSLVD